MKQDERATRGRITFESRIARLKQLSRIVSCVASLLKLNAGWDIRRQGNCLQELRGSSDDSGLRNQTG